MTEIETRKEIEEKYSTAMEASIQFVKALNELRNIRMPFDETKQDEVKLAMEMGRDIDMRTAHLLRAVLLQHGNVLFL